MSFKKNDIITFDTNEKVLVLAALKYEGSEYLYCVGLKNDEETPTEEYEILVADYSTGTLDRVVDENILVQVIPMFQQLLQDDLNNN